MKKRIGNAIGTYWRPVLVSSLTISFVLLLMWYKLGSLLPGLSIQEQAAKISTVSAKGMINNPLFLPHKILDYLLMKVHLGGAFWVRFPSTLFGILMLVGYFRIIRNWYSERVALLSSVLFACSAWLLHYARLGTPLILYVGTIALLWFGIELKTKNPKKSILIIGSIATLSLLYVPGMIWFIILCAFWQQQKIRQIISEFSKATMVTLIIIGIAACLPLIYAFIRTPSLIQTWLMIPNTLSLDTLWYNALHLPLWLALSGPVNPVYWLGSTPLLDAFALVMFILGLYAFYYSIGLDRVKASLAFIILGCALAIVAGPLVMVMIMPIIFIAIGTGIALLLQQWFTIFPKNPLARTVGVCMVTILIGLACYYNLRSYFIAWPRSPVTKQAFLGNLLQ